jgi:predicted nucleic acid-binding protein
VPDKRAKNKIGIYVGDEALKELKATAELYDIPVSRVLADAWKIARACKCKVPSGVIIFSEERGMRKRG